MKEEKLKSGAVLALQLADFDDSMALLDAILAETIGVDVDLANMSLKDLLGNDLMKLKDVLFKVISSKRVKDALWQCMASCTYQAPNETAGTAISRSTFQSEKSRGDYFIVAGEVTTFNLAPFFANLQLPSSILEKLDQLGVNPAPSTG